MMCTALTTSYVTSAIKTAIERYTGTGANLCWHRFTPRGPGTNSTNGTGIAGGGFVTGASRWRGMPGDLDGRRAGFRLVYEEVRNGVLHQSQVGRRIDGSHRARAART